MNIRTTERYIIYPQKDVDSIKEENVRRKHELVNFHLILNMRELLLHDKCLTNILYTTPDNYI
jgi:hypothetical protein